jgi:hypothetical protein
LEKLERSSPLSIERGDLAVDDQIFRGQQFQGIDKLRIIFVEVRSVAGEEPYIFTSFDGERPVAIKFHLIEPVAGRKVPDSEGHHWLNEGKVACCAFCHRVRPKYWPPLNRKTSTIQVQSGNSVTYSIVRSLAQTPIISPAFSPQGERFERGG